MQLRMLAAAAGLSVLVACGGGGSGSAAGGGPPSNTSDITITASGPTGLVPGGSTVRFDIVIASVASAASSVQGSLSLGNGLTRGVVTCQASGGAACPFDPATLNAPNLPAHSNVHFQIAAFLAPGTSGSVASTASVTAIGPTPASGPTAQVVFTAYSADISVSGTGPVSDVMSGGTANYTMTVSNAGPDAASAVVVENVVDAHQTLSAITCAAGGGATCPSPLGATMTVPTLPKDGTLTFSVAATVAAGAVGTVSNTLFASQTGDPVTSDNVATVTAATTISTASPSSFVRLQSDPGDYIGAGSSYSYSQADSVLAVSVSGGHLTFNVKGDEQWMSDFVVPNTLLQLQTGTYSNLQRFPFNDPTAGGLSWSGEGRGCNTLTGFFIIDGVTYTNGALSAIDLRFEQHCEGGGPALRGQIHWLASDTSQPPGPVNPPPAALWRAPAGTTPATGNYVYLQSDAGDFIGAGQTLAYTQANAILSINGSGGHLGVGVTGNALLAGDFQAMSSLALLQPGYYPGLRRFPFHNPARGGLSWNGDGRGCNTLTGWFVIDNIVYAGGVVTSVDLRFEQHCEGGVPALHGQIHWAPGDTTQPPGPQNPPPLGLWAPPSGTTPSSGNYVYLQSDSGDFVGRGLNYLYTPTSDTVVVAGSGRLATVTIDGAGGWTADFQTMNSIAQMLPGYYGNLQRWPFNNPTTGGLSWSGFGSGCNTLTGWFVIDSITFTNGNLASIDLRFEQHCEGGAPALHGKIHWIN